MGGRQKIFNMTNYSKFFTLITGAAGFLGSEHAKAILNIGYNLIITDIDYKKLVRLQKKLILLYPKRKIFFFKMDVSNEDSVIHVKNFIVKKKILLKCLINNAAIDPKVKKNNKISNSGKFENLKISDWDHHLNVGLKGAMICCKILGSLLSKNKNGGIILNIASDLSVIAPKHSLYEKNTFKPAMYSVIKHGIIGLTKYIATYWNKKNVRCNALSPGSVYNFQPKKFVEKIKKEIPLGRMAKKNEYHEVLQFLCTDSSRYMTGQNIVIDGGRSIW